MVGISIHNSEDELEPMLKETDYVIIFPCVSCDQMEKKESCIHCRKMFARSGKTFLHERHCGSIGKRKKHCRHHTKIDDYVKRLCI